MSAPQLLITVFEVPILLFTTYVAFKLILATLVSPPGYGPAERHPWILPSALAAFSFSATDLLNYRNGGYDAGDEWVSYLLFTFAILMFLLFVRFWRAYRTEA